MKLPLVRREQLKVAVCNVKQLIPLVIFLNYTKCWFYDNQTKT